MILVFTILQIFVYIQSNLKIFEIELTDREYDFLERVLQTASDKGILPIRLMQLFITICKPELPEDLK